jgi:hypothetical protein
MPKMKVRILQFTAIILTALALVPAGAHVLELPNKIGLDRDHYMIVQQIYRGWALYEAFPVKQFFSAFPESIAAIATGRIDSRQGVEVEICDGLQRLSCWRGAKAVGKCVEPCNIFGLQGDQFADGIAPALRAAAPIGRPAVSDYRLRHLIVQARPMASLPLGVAQSTLPFRFATSWHGFVLRYVTGLYGRPWLGGGSGVCCTDNRRGARLGRVASRRNLVFGWTRVGSGP